jgi:hypothetical protein
MRSLAHFCKPQRSPADAAIIAGCLNPGLMDSPFRLRQFGRRMRSDKVIGSDRT